MPLIDPNEVSAFIRICQDEATLQECADLCRERITLLTTPRDDVKKLVPNLGGYVHEQSHCAGGSSQPVLTGPSPGNGLGTTVAEQAAINSALIEQQAAQGRNPAQQIQGVNITGPGESATHQEALVRGAVERGQDPLVASAQARAGTGGGMGLLPSAGEGGEAGVPAGDGGKAGTGKAGDGKGGKGGGNTPGYDEKKGGPKEGTAQEGTDKAANPGHGKGHGAAKK